MTKDQIHAMIRASGLEAELHAVAEFEIPAEGLPVVAQPGYGVKILLPYTELAKDGAGGSYLLLADGRIMLLGSEAEVGVVARDFPEFVIITAGLPGWRDALRFVKGADLEAARAEWLAFDVQWGLSAGLDEPWLSPSAVYSTQTPAEARARLAAEFGKARAARDPFATLFTAVKELNTDIVVTWDGGNVPLLGTSAD